MKTTQFRGALVLAALSVLSGCDRNPFILASTNRAPVAQDQSATTVVDTPVEITLVCVDPDGNALSWRIVSAPQHGTLDGTPPAVTYTPAIAYVGTDSFTFAANDGSVDSNTATVSITVSAAGPGNHVPIASPQSVATSRDTPVAITLAATDADGDALTWHIDTQPAHGALSGTAPAVTYTPAAGYVGSDSFVFHVNDGTADSAPATVTIQVSAAVQWVQADLGFSLSGYSRVAVGDGRGDGVLRVYIGEGIAGSTATIHELTRAGSTWSDLSLGGDVTDARGIVLGDLHNDGTRGVYAVGYGLWEYLYHAGAWGNGRIPPPQSPLYFQWVDAFTVGAGRNDGYLRGYIAAYEGILELSYDYGDWNATTITPNTGTFKTGVVLAAARNDGHQRVYAYLDAAVYEWSWSGTAWSVAECGTPPGTSLAGFDAICAGAARNDGVVRVYLGSGDFDNGLFELTYDAGTWRWATLSTSATVMSLQIADCRNDGSLRIYAGGGTGVGEYSYGTSWAKTSLVATSYTVNAIAIGAGRNDGVKRLYVVGGDKHIYEYTPE